MAPYRGRHEDDAGTASKLTGLRSGVVASGFVADSSLIRLHIEDRHGIDFDNGLTPEQKGLAWACEKLVEDNLYWVVVRERWMDRANFDRGPRRFFDKAPAVVRPMVIAMIRRQVKRNLYGQGTGRFSIEEMNRLAARGIDSVAAAIGDKPFLMGDSPCGADATLFAFVGSLLCPVFESASRGHAEQHANLVGYRDRGMARWYPG